MNREDTLALLRECDAGVRMGAASIGHVLARVQNERLRTLLGNARAEHEKLQAELTAALDRLHGDGKCPGAMAKGMSQLKTRLEMALDPTDSAIADLMTDGCNMGVKALSRYLNRYPEADADARTLCRRLIYIEEQLAQVLRDYL